MRRLVYCCLWSMLLLGLAANPSFAADFTVNTTEDGWDFDPGDGVCGTQGGECTLRAAVMEANALAGDDTVSIPAGTYTLTLEDTENGAAFNDLDAEGTGKLTLVGAGSVASNVVIDAEPINDRVFEVHNGATLRLENLTVTHGFPDYDAIQGGGIRVASGGTLELDHVAVTENQAVYGGGIYNEGTLIGKVVAITDNSLKPDVYGAGGGLYLAGNTNNSVTLTRSLVAGNNGSWGGGICNDANSNYYSPVGGRLNLENVTVSGNTADIGAGILLQQGSISYLVNCTVVNNVNTSGSSGVGLMGNGASAFDFLNTLVANNTNELGVNNTYQISESTSGSDLNPAYFNQNVPFGHNMSDDGSFNSNVDVLLDSSLTTSDALAGVGTHKLQADSPAIDAGDPENHPDEDVFGTARPMGDAPDIGAYEFEDPNLPPGAPVLSSPASGYSVLSTFLKFYWKKSTDPESGKVIYRLEIARDSDFITGLRTFLVDEDGQEILLGSLAAFPLMCWVGWGRLRRKPRSLLLLVAGILITGLLFNGCGGGSCNTAVQQDEDTVSFEVSGLDAGTTYYWRVIAMDEEGAESDPSETRSFSIR